MKVTCPICKSVWDKYYLEAPALDVLNANLYQYVQCIECDVLVLDTNNIKPDDSVDYSNSGYYSKQENKAKKLIQGIASYFSLLRVHIVQNYTGKGGLKGLDILDIGCGKGGFLATSKDKGAIIHGLEPTSRSFEISSGKLGDCIENVMMSKSVYSENSMDIVTMWHVFEHIPDPVTMLSDCKYVLKEDGLLVIAVPNYRSWTAKIGGAFWFNLDPPRHVVHFSEKALRKVVEEAGFTVIDVSHFYAELTYFSFMQTILNKLPITKNFLFNYLKRNHAALPENRFDFIRDALVTGIAGFVLFPFVIILTVVASIMHSSDCITLIAKNHE